jgi:hypothetical protein
VFTELVRAIEKDPERENRLEALKLRMGVLRTQIVVSAGLIVAFSALSSGISQPHSLFLLYASFVVLILQAMGAFGYMTLLADGVRNIEEPRGFVWCIAERLYYAWSFFGFGVGLGLFALFLTDNMP